MSLLLEYSLILKIIFLGIIEGLTEFIPVSSTAHLIVVSRLIDFTSIKNNVFEIAIQIGGIIAILFVYRKKLVRVLININKAEEKVFISNVIFAFIPAVIIGLIFHDFIKEYFFNNTIIAISLIAGGLIIIIIEKDKKSFLINKIEKINPNIAIKIGLFQCVSMIPGVSRSGATILGAMLLNVNRKVATEFSFYLAIPTISSACIYDIYKNLSTLSYSDLNIIFIGIISSFLSSLLVIKWLIKYVANHNFIIFAIYRIIIGFLILFLI
jgi:undecaprenyl-diphosphatase